MTGIRLKVLLGSLGSASVILMLYAVVCVTTAFAVSNETQTMKTLDVKGLNKLGFKKTTTKSIKGISEYQLEKNGLKVLLVENHAAPVVASMIVYHVGSRNEAVGYTGATHFLEHMMFKGTSKYDPLSKTGIDDVLKKVGGMNNATTWFDRTNYFEVVPARHLALCIDIEADRMRNLQLRKSDRDAEMTVVRNELERGEDDPDELLETNLFATAFREHPYHHPTIGWRSDVEGVPLQRLRKFYDDFYWPDNATLIVIGDFQPQSALELISKKFSTISKSPARFPEVYTQEPPQEGERRFVVKRGVDIPRMVIGFHVPECLSKDTYALDVLEHVLGDSSRKSSRLYKSLVGSGKASSVDASNYSLKDPGLFVLSAQSAGNTKLEDLEKMLDKELKLLESKLVSDDELRKAKSSITKTLRLSTADPLGYAMYLTEAIAVANWRWWLDYPKEIEKVTKDDVMAVAKKYFDKDNRTVGYYYPKKDKSDEAAKNGKLELVQQKRKRKDKSESSEECKPKAVTKTKIPDLVVKSPQSINIAKNAKKTVLDNGLTIVTLNIPNSTTVAISGRINAGNQFASEAKSQLPFLVATLLNSGSSKYSKEELADELELMGCDLEFDLDTFFSEFDSHIVKEDLPKFVGILADTIIKPKFPKKELKLELNLRKSDLKERQADTGDMSWNLMVRELYKPDSPFYEKSFASQIKELTSIKAKDLKDFHRKYYTADHTIFAFVGAVDHDKTVKLCQQKFSSWKKSKHEQDKLRVDELSPEQVAVPSKAVTKVAAIPDKANVDIRIAKVLPVNFKSKDYFATVIANAALGYSSFACRLAPVRDKYGLTYGIYSTINEPSVRNAPWYIKYSVNPDNVEKAQKIVKDIVSKYVKSGITESELAEEKSHLSGNYSIYLRSPKKIASAIAFYESSGVPLSYIDNYSKNIYKVTKEEVDKAIRNYFDISQETVMAMSGTLKSSKPTKGVRK